MRDHARGRCACLFCRHRHEIPGLAETAGVLAFVAMIGAALTLVYNGVIQL